MHRRSFLTIILFIAGIVGSCGSKTGTIKVHQPKKRRRPYDPKKNRDSKRVKVVKMKNV